MGKFTIFTRIAEVEFSEIVVSSQEFNGKLRIYLTNKSFIDFFFSTKKQTQGFAIHWQWQDGNIYRIDNTPDKKMGQSKNISYPFSSKSLFHC